jgi:hypothetical protein
MNTPPDNLAYAHSPPSFRRRPESRLSERKGDPGLRRDDGVVAMRACLSPYNLRSIQPVGWKSAWKNDLQRVGLVKVCTQNLRHSGGGRNPGFRSADWIPACAGMTGALRGVSALALTTPIFSARRLETRMDRRSTDTMAGEWRQQGLSGQPLCRTSIGAARRGGACAMPPVHRPPSSSPRRHPGEGRDPVSAATFHTPNYPL